MALATSPTFKKVFFITALFQNQEVNHDVLTLFKAPPGNAEKQTHTAKHTPAYSLGNLTVAVQRHRGTKAAPREGCVWEGFCQS